MAAATGGQQSPLVEMNETMPLRLSQVKCLASPMVSRGDPVDLSGLLEPVLELV